MRRRAVQQAAVTNLGHFALACQSLDVLLRRAATVIATELDPDLVVVAQRVDEVVKIAAHAGTIELQRRFSDLRSSTQMAYTLRTIAPVIVVDRAHETRFPPSEFLALHNITSCATVPIIARSHGAWGVIAACSKARRVFTLEEVDFLRAIASVIGQAIARDLLESSLRASADRQKALAELSRLMLGSVDQAALERACDQVRSLLDVEFSLFLELDPDAHELRLRAGQSWAPEAMQRLPIEPSMQSAESIALDAPVIVTDYADDQRFSSRATFLEHGIRSGIVVPVTAGNGCTGILTAHARRARPYSADDVAFMQTLANILAEGLERDRARRDLALSEERYRDVVEGASEIIFTISPEGTLTALNSAFEWITGYRAAEWIGKPMLDLVQTRDRELVDAELALLSARTEPWQTEIAIDSPRGPLRLSMSLLAKRQNGAVTAVHGFARDVTQSHRMEHERRKLENKLEQANRIASLGRLAATIAHEFNNVLMGIAPFVEVMRRGKNIESSLDHISRAVTRGRRITQDILRFTQPAEPSRTPLDLELWLQTISLEARSLLAPNSTIDVRASADRLFIDGDPSQLQQVFTNLVLNARDAMPNGGRVTIELGREEEGAALPFALEAPERYAHFVVRDTGNGMTAEMLRHVFEPLFTTKRNGTGLGLPVALQVVQRHGGEMFVESTPGVGTAFHIFLPLSNPATPARNSEPAPAPAPARTTAKRILLVEDDNTVALGLVLLLELEGMEIRVARSGAEALSMLERDVPDVVILDVGLPDMEGTQVFEAFKNRLPHLPVIFSTGHGDRTKIEALLARPNIGFLLKPYNHATLLETIAEVTKKAKAA